MLKLAAVLPSARAARNALLEGSFSRRKLYPSISNLIEALLPVVDKELLDKANPPIVPLRASIDPLIPSSVSVPLCDCIFWLLNMNPAMLAPSIRAVSIATKLNLLDCSQ